MSHIYSVFSVLSMKRAPNEAGAEHLCVSVIRTIACFISEWTSHFEQIIWINDSTNFHSQLYCCVSLKPGDVCKRNKWNTNLTLQPWWRSIVYHPTNSSVWHWVRPLPMTLFKAKQAINIRCNSSVSSTNDSLRKQ